MNKPIKINLNISTEPILFFAFFVFFVVATNSDWRSMSLPWWGSVFLVLAAYTVSHRLRVRVVMNGFTIWWGLFFAVCCLSALAALDVGLVVDTLKTLLVLTVMLFLLSDSIRSEKNIEDLLYLMVCAISINLVYVVFTIDLQTFQLALQGLADTGRWNGNDLGMMAACIVPFLLYFLSGENKRWARRLVALAALPLACYILYTTASRKAYVMFVLGVLGFIVLRKPQKLIRNICISLVLLVAAWVAMMEVPQLYDSIGWRMEGLVHAITGKGQVDSSAQIRLRYIALGIDAFKESPILGYGIGNYSLINELITGKNTYSHNNFVELLVGTGLLGFAAYYWLYVRLIFRYLGRLLHQRCDLLTSVIALSFMLFFLMHIGFVAYSDLLPQFLVLLLFYVLRLEKRETEVQEVANESAYF